MGANRKEQTFNSTHSINIWIKRIDQKAMVKGCPPKWGDYLPPIFEVSMGRDVELKLWNKDQLLALKETIEMALKDNE